ncbi:GNAT family N-acetyltransferase [Actinoplanes sp. CA-142083]|uniref:GNAT family N-acetyltransferase n=1 Tax=Actinoplanes sp. CA-142083 TaxID=3239903 RepID=UPI003D90C9C0
MTDARSLRRMQHLVRRDWTPGSHWHVGDLAWQSPSLDDRRVAIWADGWAWADRENRLGLHVTPALIGDALAWFDEVATGEQKCTAMETDTALLAALTAAGYKPVDEPFFRHCLRELDDTLPAPELPPGYRVRATRPGEDAERAAVHRAAWRPGAPDGTLVASALGWYDDVNRTALLEPVGTDAEHARRGLGAAVSLACLRAMRDAGARLAVVCPRGDDAYPVPRQLYHRLGFRDAGRTVTYARD